MSISATSDRERLANITEALGCSICHDIMTGPSTLSCGHSACLSCLKECFRTCGNACPICRKYISAQEMVGLTVSITLSQALHVFLLYDTLFYALIPPPVPVFLPPVIGVVVKVGPLAGGYFGQLRDGKMHGQGMFICNSGMYKGYVFDGGWKEGKREGGGRTVYSDGSTRKGIWRDGKCISLC